MKEFEITEAEASAAVRAARLNRLTLQKACISEEVERLLETYESNERQAKECLENNKKIQQKIEKIEQADTETIERILGQNSFVQGLRSSSFAVHSK